MKRYAPAVALLCLQTACATPGTTSVDAPGPQTGTDAVVPSRAGTEADTTSFIGPAAGERDRALLEAIRTLSPYASELEDRHVFFAFEDLNKDGVAEAVVHVTGEAFCGTGGCTTLVYQWDSSASAYALIDNTPTTRPPIYVSAREGCRWSMLWVQRSGGGRQTELHSPKPLRDVESCDTPVGKWNEAESKLLVPVYESRDEETSL